MRLVGVVALVCACSFEHGRASDDGGVGDADGPSDVVVSPMASPRKLLFDNSASTVDFGPHPVLLALDATKIDYSVIADPRTDLRFEYATAGMTASIGDNVPFEVEKWDPAGESIVWIRVPEILHGTTNTAVLMHFGPGAGGSSSAQATWTSWELVNHMATGLTNSAGAYTPTAINMTFAAGQIGEAAVFGNTGDHRVTFASGSALFDGWSTFFLSFWIYADYADAADLGQDQPLVMDKGTSINLGRFFVTASNIVFQLDQHFTGSNNDVYLNTIVPPRTWTNIAIDFDGNLVRMLNNGAPTGSIDLTGSAQTLLGSTAQFHLGDNGNAFRGMLDELRIERRNRSTDFARAQYLNATRKFVTFTDP